MSNTRTLSRLAAAIVSAAMGLGFAAPAQAQTPDQIQPILNCVDILPGLWVRAHFGYVSTYSTEVTFPVGLDNFFTPAIINRGQPTTFEPGYHDRVFSTQWQRSGSIDFLTWVVQQNRSASATLNTGLLCGARSRGDWDTKATYAEGDLVRYNGALFVNYVASGRGCPDTPANTWCWLPYAPSPPVISDIPDQTTYENWPIKAIPFTLSDADNLWNVTVLADSSDRTLVPVDNIIFAGYGGNRLASVFPASNRKGTAVITLYVSDGFSVAIESFAVIIVAPPSAGADSGGQE